MKRLLQETRELVLWFFVMGLIDKNTARRICRRITKRLEKIGRPCKRASMCS